MINQFDAAFEQISWKMNAFDRELSRLQLLTWAKLSYQGTIPESMRLDDTLLNTPICIRNAMEQIGKDGSDDLERLAFEQLDWMDSIDAFDLRPPLKIARQLASTHELDFQTILKGVDTAFMAMGDHDGMAVSPGLAELLVKLSHADQYATAYLPWDVTGQTAAMIANAKAASGQTVDEWSAYVEIPNMSAVTALLSLLNDHPFTVKRSDPIASPSAVADGRLMIFDTAIATPPPGKRYGSSATEHDFYSRFKDGKNKRDVMASGTALAIMHVLAQTRHRAVVVVPNTFLFSSKDMDLRRYLFNDCLIKAVIALPQRLTAYKQPHCSVLVLEKNSDHCNLRYINADTHEHRKSENRRLDLDHIDTLVRIAEGQETSPYAVTRDARDVITGHEGSLLVSRFVLSEDKRKLLTRMENLETIRIGDVFDTYRPMSAVNRGEIDDEQAKLVVREVAITNLVPYGYIRRAPKIIEISQETADKNHELLLQEHDIVMTVRGSAGSVGRVGIVPAKEDRWSTCKEWVAVQSTIILRKKPGVPYDPRVLFMQLRSELGQALISNIIISSNIDMIQLRDLKALKLVVPDDALAEQSLRALEREAAIQLDIRQLKSELHACARHIWDQI